MLLAGWIGVATAMLPGIALILLVIVWRSGDSGSDEGATFTARRGSLDITVLEGGSVQALDAQEIKCEVRVGYQAIKILKIV